MAYLDDTGLAYFWSRLKAWAQGLFALIGHTHTSSDVAAMTGYSKPPSGSAVAASDTLNQAVGKIEAKVDAIDGDYVHRTGAAETITSLKTLSSKVSGSTDISLLFRHPDLVRGTVPSSALYFNIPFLDSSGAFWDTGGSHGRMGNLECGVLSNGSLYTQISAYRPVAGSAESAYLAVGFLSSGDAFSWAVPTPVSNPDSRDIVTRGYLDGGDSGVVHLSSVETITGCKYFTGGTSGTNKDNSTDNANSLYNTVTGIKNIYFTTGNSVTKLTNLPAAKNTILESRNIRYYSDSDKYIEQICHNGDGIYYRMGSGTGWSSWKKFAFVEDVVTKANAQTVTGTKTFENCDIILRNGSPYYYCDDVNIPASGTPSSYTLGGVTLRNSDKSKIIAGLRLAADARYTQARLSVTSLGSGIVNRSVVLEEYANATNFYPDTTDVINLGAGSFKWSVVYAATGTINTSDARLKNSVVPVPDAFLDAWENVAFRQFRFNDSVAKKGDGARIHAGVVAQDVQKAFEAAGIDAGRYGFFCWDSWEGRESYDDDGNPVPERYVPAGDQYSIRYEELLCIEAAYQRRENARLKKRIVDLEERLAALELKIA